MATTAAVNATWEDLLCGPQGATAFGTENKCWELGYSDAPWRGLQPKAQQRASPVARSSNLSERQRHLTTRDLASRFTTRLRCMNFLSHWQATLIIVGWGYASLGMLFVLATKKELLARSSRELFMIFPDIAVALGIIMGLFPQYVASTIANYVLTNLIQ
jgi:hypothetical protein